MGAANIFSVTNPGFGGSRAIVSCESISNGSPNLWYRRASADLCGCTVTDKGGLRFESQYYFAFHTSLRQSSNVRIYWFLEWNRPEI